MRFEKRRCARSRAPTHHLYVALLLAALLAAPAAIAQEVSIPDDKLRERIASTLNVDPAEPITEDQMETLTGLFAVNIGIVDLTGLEFAVNLTRLSLGGNPVADLSPLAGLTALTHLTLDYCDLTDISHLAGLTALTDLDLSNNRLTDISHLAGLTALTTLKLRLNNLSVLAPLAGLGTLTNLDLSGNRLTNVHGLAGLPALKTLRIGSNSITDISGLAGIATLTNLNASLNRISHTAPLAGLFSLTAVSLNENDISDLSGLASLTSLQQLALARNKIRVLSPLARLTRLSNLDLSSNDISDLSSLAGLTALWWLNLSDNDITSVSPLAGLGGVGGLFLSGNRITDLSGLAALTSLRTLELDGNDVDDISPLRDLAALTTLRLLGNAISDLSAITGKTSLRLLDLGSNDVSDLSALSDLPSLSVLQLVDNDITDLAPLAELPLWRLYIGGNDIDDLSPLVDNASLGDGSRIYLWRNPLTADSLENDVPELRRRGALVLFETPYSVPLVIPASDERRQTFLRIAGRYGGGGVWIHAIDGDGRDGRAAFLPTRYCRGHRCRGRSYQTIPLNSDDLESGNRKKGLRGRLGSAGGDRRLELYAIPELDSRSFHQIEVSTYVRTNDGFLTSMQDFAPRADLHTKVRSLAYTANPGSNEAQVSILRLINPGAEPADVVIQGVDDSGASPGDTVSLSIPAGATRVFTTAQLEAGTNGLDGALGDGRGKWQLTVESDDAVHAMSLLSSPTGHITNLSTVPRRESPAPVLFFPRAGDPDLEGFVRVVNDADHGGEVRIEAFDDTGSRYGPATLAIGALQTVHFNSTDLESGNADKGLTPGVGTGTGDWRLELTPDARVQLVVLSYVRTSDGFVTTMHDKVQGRQTREIHGRRIDDLRHIYTVPTFNPGSNTNQVSRLRLLSKTSTANVVVTGFDELGRRGEESISIVLGAGEARTYTAQELESGDGLDAGLGDGHGKWELDVVSDVPIDVMSLLRSPTGHLTNLSTAPVAAPVPAYR